MPKKRKITYAELEKLTRERVKRADEAGIFHRVILGVQKLTPQGKNLHHPHVDLKVVTAWIEEDDHVNFSGTIRTYFARSGDDRIAISIQHSRAGKSCEVVIERPAKSTVSTVLKATDKGRFGSEDPAVYNGVKYEFYVPGSWENLFATEDGLLKIVEHRKEMDKKQRARAESRQAQARLRGPAADDAIAYAATHFGIR